MSDFENRYLAALVIYKIDDPVTALSHPITIIVSGELFRALGPRFCGNRLNSLHDPLPISLSAYGLELPCG
jgi:hypothetical protein